MLIVKKRYIILQDFKDELHLKSSKKSDFIEITWGKFPFLFFLDRKSQ